jgi:hypothetical protein
MTATAARTITAQQAQAYARVEAQVKRAEAQLREAKAERQKLRDRYWPLCPVDVELDVGGYLLKASMRQIAKSFSLVEYEKHHPVTPEMEPFVKDGGRYQALAIKPNDERKALGLGL